MSDEQKESRIKVEDLPQEEKELSKEEQKQVKGAIIGDDQGVYTGIRVDTGNMRDADNITTGAGAGGGPHVKGK